MCVIVQVSASSKLLFVLNACQTVRGKEGRISMIIYAGAILFTYTMCVCACVSELVVCLEFLFHFSVGDLQTVLTFSKMAPAVQLPGKNSKRMECAANKVGLAPLCLNYSVLVNRSIPVYVGLNLPWLILHPGAQTRVLNSGQDFGNCQPSILNSPTPEGKICHHILVMGLQRN